MTLASDIVVADRLIETTAALTLVGNNTTLSMVAFTVTGSVLLVGLWGEVTTVIGANHTAAHFRTNDQTATINITAAAGITLSALKAGTMFLREGLVASALELQDNAAAKFEDPAAAGDNPFTPFIVTKKTAAVTTIDYRYSTTDAPTSGVITVHALWQPLSGDGALDGSVVVRRSFLPTRYW